MRHVFISYVREDSAAVDEIYEELTARGIKVWLDRTSISPGDRWEDAIRNAIREGTYFLACFSPALLARERSHMNEELALAVDELRKRLYGRRWFIPVRLAPCDIPEIAINSRETLGAFQRVDLFPDWECGLLNLLRSLNAAPTHEQVLQHYRARYQVRQRQDNAASVLRTTTYEPINLTTHDVRLAPGFYCEVNEVGKYRSVNVRILELRAGAWMAVHTERDMKPAHAQDQTVRFQAQSDLVLHPASLRSSPRFKVEFSVEMDMQWIDRDIMASIRPLDEVTIGCQSDDNCFIFSVGDAPGLVETRSGAEWVLEGSLQARENLNIRWHPRG